MMIHSNLEGYQPVMAKINSNFFLICTPILFHLYTTDPKMGLSIFLLGKNSLTLFPNRYQCQFTLDADLHYSG